jgi:hypothetical protein
VPPPRPETPSALAHSETPAVLETKRALVVLGMHRSGTSALTRVLGLLGADLPSRLLEPAPDAERGYWESADLVTIHERLLASAGLAWDDVLPIPDSWWQSTEAQGFQREVMDALARDFSTSTLFVIKDPRICRLLPLWKSALAQLGTEPLFILCVRNPLEVIDSLKARNGFSPARSALLWLRYVIEAERGSRDGRRVVVSFESLLRDWRGVADQLSRGFGIAWPSLSTTTDLAVESFLDRKLRHQDRTYDDLHERQDIVEWVRQVYTALKKAEAGDQTGLAETVDAVRRQLELAERTYLPLLLEDKERLQAFEHRLEQAQRESATGIGTLERRLTAAERDAAAQTTKLEAEKRVLTEEIAGWRAERDRLDARVGSLTGELSVAREIAHERRLTLAGLEERLRGLQTRNATLETALETLRAERDAQEASARALQADLSAQIVELTRELRSVLNSTSWRLTGPVRRLLSGNGWSTRFTRDTAEMLRRFLASGSALERLRRNRNRRVIEASGIFDSQSYVRRYAHVTESGLSPIAHYVDHGAREGLSPCALFDPAYYLSRNPDVARAGVNPLAHYLTHGALEGRRPTPLFDSEYYLSHNADVVAAGVNPLVHYVQRGAAEGRNPCPLFDSAYYMMTNPGVVQAGTNPLAHYIEHGATEGRDPNPYFCSRYYMETNPDVAATDSNPLAHFIEHGWIEGRDPSPSLDNHAYLNLHPELARHGTNPLERFPKSSRAPDSETGTS